MGGKGRRGGKGHALGARRRSTPSRPSSRSRPSCPAIGFIGFGEAGSTIAAGLRSAGVDRLFAFDINTHAPQFGPAIQQRAVQSRTTLVESSAELAQSSEILLSTV